MNMHTGSVTADSFKEAMARLAGGVSLVTTRDGQGIPLGMVATAVTSVSAEPPTVLVCVNRSASLYSHLQEQGIFCVNFLAQDHRDLVTRFSSSTARASRFDGGGWMQLTTGAPVLEDALASLDCRLEGRVENGTHTVFLGQVLEAKAGAPRPPLIHYNRGFGGLASL